MKLDTLFASSALAIMAVGVWSTERYLALRRTEEARNRAAREIEGALSLVRKHPTAFGAGTGLPTDSSMKALVQETAASRGVAIAYLSETERDVQKGHRERQTLVRVAQVPHRNLVHFLEDLERGAIGARVKEIHLRPSKSTSDLYEEAEVVLSRFVAQHGEKP